MRALALLVLALGVSGQAATAQQAGASRSTVPVAVQTVRVDAPATSDTAGPALLTAVATHATAQGARIELHGPRSLPEPEVLLGSSGHTVVLTFVPTAAGPTVVLADSLALGPWATALPGLVFEPSGDTLRLIVTRGEPLVPSGEWMRLHDGGLALAFHDDALDEPTFYTLDPPTRPNRADADSSRARPHAPDDPNAPAFYTLDAPARWTFDTVVLDAGHGGHDAGAHAHGIREKDVTLGVVRRLGPLLEREGIRVVYTRTTDVFIPLRERGRLANAAEGRLFVSVHVNATATGAPARGTETYLMGLHKTDAAEAVMRRENSVIELESDRSAYARLNPADAVLVDLAGAAFQGTSARLAALVEAQFRGQGRQSRGVKQAGFYVLWNASMPAVLVETGFVNDPREAAYLGSAAGQQEVADAIFRAIQALRQE